MSTRFLDSTAAQFPTRHKTATLRLALLERWHLLSLDAPCVSTLWTWFLVRCAGRHPTPATLLAMFLAVWILYAGDRLLDARAVFGGMDDVLEERHFFHARHRRGFLAGMGVASIALTVSLLKMPRSLFGAYLVLSTMLTLWLGIIHTSRTPARLPKEFAVGLFFGVAVALPSWMAGSPGPACLAAVFGASTMCTANCLFLLSWESGRRRPRGEAHSGPVHPGATFALRRLVPLASTAACFCAVAGCIALALHRSVAAWPLAAAALSLALLLLLHRLRSHLSTTTLRALADVALLTPLLFAPLLFAPLFFPHLLLREVLR